MGASCSSCQALEPQDGASRKDLHRRDAPLDPEMYSLMRRSVGYSEHDYSNKMAVNQNSSNIKTNNNSKNPQSASSFRPVKSSAGQGKLLYRNQKKDRLVLDPLPPGRTTYLPPTRLLVRRHAPTSSEEGLSGTHIYAIRYPTDQPLMAAAPKEEAAQEQAPQPRQKRNFVRDDAYKTPSIRDGQPVDHLFRPAAMAPTPRQQVIDWVTVSEEHNIHVADVGLTPSQCDQIIQVTEHVCRGQYAAYTYAKQTLGCREFPQLATICQPAIHTMTNFLLEFSQNRRLCLDDREPHMVKYDVTKREKSKLDMHTDKSEFTFLISLSNGCGMDFEGGGTYFECLDATLHIQRGHALVFPGKLRHCGQRITSGLRFLLVAFLVDKTGNVKIKPEDSPPAPYHANVP